MARWFQVSSMCGYVIDIAPDSSVQRVEILASSLDHRGPDSEGNLDLDWLSVGFRRLAIIDLSDGASQPMTRGALSIVHNGEIYNFRELREQLKALGHRFQTDSDTEVFLLAFVQWGTGCVARFRGMFATAIIDDEKKQVTIFRDQIGIKPLYYRSLPDSRVVVASETKVFAQTAPVRLDREKAVESFVHMSVIGPRTMIEGVFTVLPGQVLRISADGAISDISGGISTGNASIDPRDDSDLSTESLLKESIGYRLVSDVDLGLQLSGGVDSSLIAAIVQTHFERSKLHSFSISLKDDPLDESIYQRQVESAYGLEHHDIPFDENDFERLLPRAVYHHDFPITQPNAVAIMHLAQYARQYVTVLLSGEGADETFLGYPKYRILVSRRIPDLLRSIGPFEMLVPPVGKLKTAKWLARIGHDFASSFVNSRISRVAEYLTYPIGLTLDSRAALLRAMGNPDDALPKYDQITSLEPLLMRYDRMTMAESIEGRVPFCDTRLVAHANALPLSEKATRGQLKIRLKGVAEKYLPYELIYRPKVGFSLPLPRWFTSVPKIRELIDVLRDRKFIELDLVNSKKLEQLTSKREFTESDVNDALWPMISFELWRREFSVG